MHQTRRDPVMKLHLTSASLLAPLTDRPAPPEKQVSDLGGYCCIIVFIWPRVSPVSYNAVKRLPETLISLSLVAG